MLIKLSNRKCHIPFISGKKLFDWQIRIFPVMEFDIRILFPECHKTVRRKQTQDSICRQEIYNLLLSLFNMQNIFLYLIIIVYILQRILAESLSAFRKLHPGLIPDKQLTSHLCLKVLQYLTCSLRCHIKDFGCFRNTAFLCDHQKYFQIMNIHLFSPSFTHLSIITHFVLPDYISDNVLGKARQIFAILFVA